jgi:hypothetical protein
VRHFEGEGYVLVAFLFTCKLIETVMEHQYNFFCARLDMYVKSALTAAVYRKVSLYPSLRAVRLECVRVNL